MSTSKERFVEAYRAGLDWLRRQQLKIAGSRFEGYETILARFVEENGVPNDWPDEDKFHLYDALMAAMDLNDSHERFGATPLSPGLRSRLVKMLDGTGTERQERPGMDGSTEGRDFGFEIALGSHLDAAGLDPVFPKVGDLELVVEGSDVLIECKRPQFDHSVKAAIEKAADQIHKRTRNAQRLPVGIIALSLGKLFRQGELMLPAPSLEAGREEILRTIGDLLRNWPMK